MDWTRLIKALAVEADRGFSNLMGCEYRFSGFMSQSFSQPPEGLQNEALCLWQEIATQFTNYPALDHFQRQQLLEHTKKFLYLVEFDVEGESSNSVVQQCDNCLDKQHGGFFIDEENWYGFDEKDWVGSVDYLDSIEHEPGLTLSQKIDLVNGRKILINGREVNYLEYLRNKEIRERLRGLGESDYEVIINWTQLQKYIEVETDQGFSDIVCKDFQLNKTISSSSDQLLQSLLDNALGCRREIQFSKFVSLSLSQLPKSLPDNTLYLWREIALKFARYSTLTQLQRQDLIEGARQFFSQMQIYSALRPRNRPKWADDYNPYARYDLLPGDLPHDKSVDLNYLKELRGHLKFDCVGDYEEAIRGIGSTNALLKEFFEIKGRLPEDEFEFQAWIEGTYIYPEGREEYERQMQQYFRNFLF